MKFSLEFFLFNFLANILKVYGDRLNPEIPYKSLLLLPTDNVTTVIRDALDKYNLGKEQIQDYNLIQVITLSIYKFSCKNSYLVMCTSWFRLFFHLILKLRICLMEVGAWKQCSTTRNALLKLNKNGNLMKVM